MMKFENILVTKFEINYNEKGHRVCKHSVRAKEEPFQFANLLYTIVPHKKCVVNSQIDELLSIFFWQKTKGAFFYMQMTIDNLKNSPVWTTVRYNCDKIVPIGQPCSFRKAASVKDKDGVALALGSEINGFILCVVNSNDYGVISQLESTYIEKSPKGANNIVLFISKTVFKKLNSEYDIKLYTTGYVDITKKGDCSRPIQTMDKQFCEFVQHFANKKNLNTQGGGGFFVTIDELKQKPLFVNWKWFEREGKWSKMPVDPHNGYPAKVNAPKTWDLYSLPLANIRNGLLKPYSSEPKKDEGGIGVMFGQLSEEYMLCGIDIDGHKKSENQLAEEVLQLFKGTYAEISPSGSGYHILLAVSKTKLCKISTLFKSKYYQKNPYNELECYIAGLTNRYFTFSENVAANYPISDMDKPLQTFLDRYMLREKNTEGGETIPIDVPSNVSVPAASSTSLFIPDIPTMLDIARKSRNGEKFTALYDKGDISAYSSDDSAADLGLCKILAFYLQGDYEKIDTAFRGSALMREKWEKRSDYRKMTIEKAIKSCNKFYTPPKPKAVDGKTYTAEENKKRERLDIDLFKKYLKEKGYKTRTNQITHSFEYVGFSGENAEHLNNLVPIRLKSELEKIYSGVTNDTINDYVYWVTANNVYNPILDLINKEITAGELGERENGWDGIDRIEEIYRIFEIDESDNLSRTLIRKWLMQAYCGLHNDISNPFSLDIVLVFQGGQGIGKTRFFEKLSLVTSCFGEAITIDPSNTDSVKAATSKWICELGEIGSTMKKDIDKVKAFLTKATDEYRLPYARDFVCFPRRTSFVGTVNDTEFLIDQTGNRRFATVPIKPNVVIDYDTKIKPFNALKLWVQVAYIVDQEIANGKTYANCFRLTPSERMELAKRNSKFTKPMKGEIEVLDTLKYLETPEDGYELGESWQTIGEFKKGVDTLKNVDSGTIGRVLGKLGTEKRIVDKRNKTSEYLLPHKKWNGTT